MQIGSWGGHTFEVGPGLIRSFTALTMRGSADVEEKTSSNQKYVRRKAGNANELTLTVVLSAYMGCDVRAEALAFVEDARACAEDYFYVAGQKLLPETLMLTEATVSEVQISPTGEMVSAQVQLTMKQSAKGDAKGSGSGGGSGGKKSTTTKTASTDAEKKKQAQEKKNANLKTTEEIVKKAKLMSGKKVGHVIAGGRKNLSTIAMK